ncbi:MAG: PilZ domain-containing protein [Candidatus Omnitrophota bacterium]|nr:MAG: PilZ domain-containing protein [Candidatus Omnitrophota bacterium]
MSWDKKERRQFVRACFPCKLSVHPCDKNAIHTQTENISAGGIRVFIARRLKPASIVTVTIYKIKKDPIICQGRIIWVFSRKHPENEEQVLFDTGIEFHQITEETAFEIKNIIESLS